jgi:hypothetical protein
MPKYENYHPENQTRMDKNDKISHKMHETALGKHYVIIPEKTQEQLDKKMKTKDVSKYWEQDQLEDVLKNNFKFEDEKWYNIYALYDEGWRLVSKESKKGKHLTDTSVKVLKMILDSNANTIDDDERRIYALEIEEVDLNVRVMKPSKAGKPKPKSNKTQNMFK